MFRSIVQKSSSSVISVLATKFLIFALNPLLQHCALYFCNNYSPLYKKCNCWRYKALFLASPSMYWDQVCVLVLSEVLSLFCSMFLIMLHRVLSGEIKDDKMKVKSFLIFKMIAYCHIWLWNWYRIILAVGVILAVREP